MSKVHDATKVATPTENQSNIDAIRFDIAGSILKYSSHDDVREIIGGIASSGACIVALAATPDGGWAPVLSEQLCGLVLGDVAPRAPEGWEPPTRSIDEMASSRWWEELSNEAHTRGMGGDEAACRDYFFYERCAHVQQLAYRDAGRLPASDEGDMYLILDAPRMEAAGAIGLLERLFATDAVFSFEVSIDGVWWTYSHLDLDRVLH